MKKTTLLKTIILLLTLSTGSTSVWAETVNVINENFSSNNSKDKLVAADWTITGTTSHNTGYMQIASGSGAGSATTPAFSSLEGTEATLSITHVSSGKASRTLTITGVNCKVNGNSSVNVTVNGSGSGANTSIINITNASTNSKITFSAESNQGTKITNVVVSYTTTSSSPLDYISLSGTYPTTFDFNDEFSYAGMTVTATYENGDTNDVTSKASFSGYNMTSAGNQTVTVSYTENEVTKTTTYDITVNPYTQPTTVTIQMTNSLFGEEVHTSGKSTANLTFSGTQDGVTVTYYVPNDSYYYFNTSNTRPYNTCTLDYAAPTGYVITKIVFTSDGSNWETATPSVGKMSATKQWEGIAGNVTFSWETSGTRIKTVVVSLAEPATISLNSACTDGEKIYGTYSNSKSFVVPDGLTVSAVGISDGKLVVTNYETGNIVKANTGVMVSATSAGDKTVALSSETGTEISGNCLKPTGSGLADAAAMSAIASGCKYYRLTMHNTTDIGFWWGAENGAAFAYATPNRAFLAVPNDVDARGLWFAAGETTALSEVRGLKADVRGEYFNLNGQRIAQPTKGLYIINGKKVVIK